MSTFRATDLVGRVLGGRYRLLALIGSGGAAQVYLADDERLQRKVAVKVLHPLLADEAAFARRFEAEARSVAALSHPNLLAIFDWGEDDGPFLVTEYLSGGSLAAILGAGHRLSLSQALVVALAAAQGLEHAHDRGIVHRDVKPANLLFGGDARLRVADFGVARAVAEASLTEAEVVAPGTVRYASPEQARGQTIGPAGDVYALGLVIVEAVSGSTPFARDTPLATLLARTEHPLVADPAFGPLRRPVERAGRVEPDDRPTAGELAEALLAAAESLPPPEPLPLEGTHVGVADDDPTMVGGVAALVVPDTGSAAGNETEAVGIVSDRTATQDPWSAGSDRSDPERPGSGSGAGTAAAEPEVAVFDHEADVGPARRRRWPWAVLALVVAAALAVGAVALLSTPPVPTHVVPDLVGSQDRELEATVGEFGWSISRSEERRDGTDPGEIIAQDPAPGTELEEGERLAVTVSLGPTLVAVPGDLEGLSLDDATAQLSSVGLAVGEVTETSSEDVPSGVVLSVGVTEAELPKGSQVPLEVSAGPPPRTIPGELVGQTYDEVDRVLTDLGLVPVRVDEASDTVEEGRVIATEPGEGAEGVPKGAEVRVVVSTGPPVVVIPDLAGRTTADAADELEALGLEVEGTRGSPNDPVVSTDPPAGTEVRKGSSVTLDTRDPDDD